MFSSKTVEIDVPEDYICPITQKLIEDPVFAADGHTYEKIAIQEWFEKHDTSPITNLKLENKNLIPNYAIKSCIQAFLENKNKPSPKELELKQRLENAEKILFEIQNKCFDNYSEIKEPLQILLNSKLEKANEEWNKRNDEERYELLNTVGLGDSSYDFLKTDFKQLLSEGTQVQRHVLSDLEGKHPSIEDFWKNNKELQKSWLKKV